MRSSHAAKLRLFDYANGMPGSATTLDDYLSPNEFGLMSGEAIRIMAQRKMVRGHNEIEESQLQPASLDLRLGNKAFRVRSSFLPGKERSVEQALEQLKQSKIDLDADGTVLERGCVYVIPLQEYLQLQPSIIGIANPKSSTGRLDIFTRLITDNSEVFDNVSPGYQGPLYAEVCPRSFSIRVRPGSRLNQIRFRRRNSQQQNKFVWSVSDDDLRRKHSQIPLVDGDLSLRDGLMLRVALSKESLGDVIGYRAQKHTDVIDVDAVGIFDPLDYWERIYARPDRRLILDPGEFYILASNEKIHIPPTFAAEMVPIDPMMGEFRVHYAGFFDPGFGFTTTGHPGSRAVLEVRSHDVPFIVEDGQFIGRLVYEQMARAPTVLYGQSATSNYQGQGLKLSKHFKLPN